MLKSRRAAIVPMLAAGLASVVLAGCSTYGAGSYGSHGRSYPSYGYSTPYSYGRGSLYATPRAYDRGYYPGYGSHGYSRGHNGFGHLGGRRH